MARGTNPSASQERLADVDSEAMQHIGCCHVVKCAWSFVYIGIFLSFIAFCLMLNFIISKAEETPGYSNLYFFEKVGQIIVVATTFPLILVDLLKCIVSMILYGSVFYGIQKQKKWVLLNYLAMNFWIIIILLTMVIMNLSAVLNGANIFFIILDTYLMFLVFESYRYIRDIQQIKNRQANYQTNTIHIAENGRVSMDGKQNA